MLRSRRAAALIAALASLPAAAQAQAAVDPLSGRSVAPVFSGPFAEVPRAADAPPAVDPTWLYKGKRINPSTGADRELKCMDDETLITRCFDTESQLEAAEASLGLAPGAGSDGVVASAARKILRRHKHRSGRAANHTGTSGPLSLWRDSPPGGWRVDTYSSCTWFDLPGSYNNATSYSNSGAHTAALADLEGGRLPGVDVGDLHQLRLGVLAVERCRELQGTRRNRLRHPVVVPWFRWRGYDRASPVRWPRQRIPRHELTRRR